MFLSNSLQSTNITNVRVTIIIIIKDSILPHHNKQLYHKIQTARMLFSKWSRNTTQNEKWTKKIELNWVECYAIGWIFIVVLCYFVHCVMVMLWVSVSLVHVHFKHVWAWCFPWRWNMKEKCACVQFVYSPCENRIANSIVLKKNDSKKDSNDIELHLCNAVASYRMHGLFFVSVAIVANEKQFAKLIQWMNKKYLFFTLFFLTDKIKESTSLDWTRKVKILKNKNLFFKLVR